MNFSRRTHSCGELTKKNVDQSVILNGWIHSRRDLGKLIFLDLRDRYGLTQVALDTSASQELMELGHQLRPEFVLAVNGTVRPRPDEALNPNMKTGEIEVAADSIQILNTANTPPFEISDEIQVSDELRMRYRYLDMRRPSMLASMELRHRVLFAFRKALNDRGFLEVETPLLTKSTPEGARDFLVPARVQAGKFYALPQSPQLFKQLLMVGGVDKYFQMVKCLRDEDLRADRQPEFTQLDLEMSFVDEEDIYSVMEEIVAEAVEAAGHGKIDLPLPRIAYDEAMARFGSDKPDTRFGMEFFDLHEVAAGCGFKVFKSVADSGGAVLGINVPGGSTHSRKDIDNLTKYVGEFGAKGLAWFKHGDEGLTGPIAKFFQPEELEKIIALAAGKAGDLILIIAAPPKTARMALSELRLELGRRMNLMGDGLAFTWVTEFPMFEEDEETGALIPTHHPFTTPHEEYEGHLEKDPRTLKARAYDLVLNGYELGSGSVRIHQRGLQTRVFKALGIDEDTAREKFGFLLDAFEYGAPPHAGIALGMDRVVMILAGMDNIRDVIAFPKTTTGGCPLTSAPTRLDPALLEELGLVMKEKKPKKM
jgi:aspartyl-tRNA synthetase